MADYEGGGVTDLRDKLRAIAGQMYVNELRSSERDAAIFRQWKMVVTEAAAALDPSTCQHDYDALDDKGWECKRCGHQT